MNTRQWQVFCRFREDFKKQIEEWSQRLPNLKELQKKAAMQAKTPEYPFETPLVYNSDLDKISQEDEIKLIVIGDNPGKDEQREQNRRYLCGQAGKLAEGFFKKNPELGIDFRKNVIILNKTPVHSAKTAQLRTIMKEGGEKAEALVLESQLWMAEKTAGLHIDLLKAASSDSSKKASLPQLWLVGYSELKGKGFFIPYRDRLLQIYKNQKQEDFNSFWQKVLVFQHFSMNRFTIDLDAFVKKDSLNVKKADEKANLEQLLCMLGEFHKKEIFGD